MCISLRFVHSEWFKYIFKDRVNLPPSYTGSTYISSVRNSVPFCFVPNVFRQDTIDTKDISVPRERPIFIWGLYVSETNNGSVFWVYGSVLLTLGSSPSISARSSVSSLTISGVIFSSGALVSISKAGMMVSLTFVPLMFVQIDPSHMMRHRSSARFTRSVDYMHLPSAVAIRRDCPRLGFGYLHQPALRRWVLECVQSVCDLDILRAMGYRLILLAGSGLDNWFFICHYCFLTSKAMFEFIWTPWSLDIEKHAETKSRRKTAEVGYLSDSSMKLP